MSERPHKRLRAWQKAIDLVEHTYGVTKTFPKSEEFGLKSQLRRAAVSVPSNIAEGLTRKNKGDKLHFLNMAHASLSEIDTQLEISRRLSFINQDGFEKMESALLDAEMLLSGLLRSMA